MIPKKSTRKLRTISLFTGVGGLDFGFEAAGFKTAVAIEMDTTCCRTLKLNRKWPVIERPVEEITSYEILARAKLKVGQADALIGGPPCQPFSKSGYWATGDAARLADPRASTLDSYLRVLEDTLPQTFLLENVGGLAYRGKDEGLKFLWNGVARINRRTGSKYRIACEKLNAANYGVPQLRERVFLIAHRDGRPFTFPSPTHGPGTSEAYRTAWDAIGDMNADPTDSAVAMSGYWADLLPSIPEGENYLHHTKRGGGLELFGWRRRYWSFLLKLAKDRPSWTLQAQPGPAIGPFHWKNRRLTQEELCRLQTFPEDIKFDCGRNDIQRMLGNAVPSLLAEVLAREIRHQLLQLPMKKPLVLLPPRRTNRPDAEPTLPVPKKYHVHVGDHEEHPGEGKGRGALLRETRDLLIES